MAGLLARGSSPLSAFPGTHPVAVTTSARRLQLRGQRRLCNHACNCAPASLFTLEPEVRSREPRRLQYPRPRWARQRDVAHNVFIWAYERSAARYAAVRQSLGEPNPFGLKYRSALRDVVRTIVLKRQDRKATLSDIAKRIEKSIAAQDRQQFSEMVENEVLTLHAGNFARHPLKPSQFWAWQNLWSAPF